MLSNKQFGIGLMIFSILLLFIGLMYIYQTESFVKSQIRIGPKGECVHEGTICPYEQLNRLSVPKYIGGFLLIAIFSFGLYLFFKKKPEEIKVSNARKIVKNLGGDELKVYDTIFGSSGMMFQNEIVDKLQFSKVKVTRILDRLEMKGLIERKRRGMTNIIVLK